VRGLFLLFFILIYHILYADKNPDPRQDRKTAFATKTTTPPRINGNDDDSIWMSIPAITDFRQYQPQYDANPSFRTEVKIAYDDYAIYVLAYMFDPNPDSILQQLGLRDQENLNADMFSIEFDTYNNQLDAYTFRVTASGVQFDARESDETYDAVWDSEVRITKKGWTAELRIPYSALRFAQTSIQTWGMEISRSIRRYRETNQWSLEMLEAKNDLPYWGILTGIEKIKPPLRLSMTPYIVLQAEHFKDVTTKNAISTAFGGGLDLKYGLNESFTLDMSLLPDFSQVQSDNKVKNLTAFETVYKEQRPFFKEAVDLFMKGNIFYSRRIGKTPFLFYSVDDSLNDGEDISKNPVHQRLVNATKISGRNKKGLAIGFLNAITANTYAIINQSDGNTRKILTDPLTNYNLIVFDQALKNNSSFYLTNSNVIRQNSYRDANVTATGLTINDKSNTYRISLSGGLSQVFTKESNEIGNKTVKRGYKYGIQFSKTNGNFQWNVVRETMDREFDANDMGLTRYSNYNDNILNVSYNIYSPFWVLRNMTNKITISNQNNYSTHKPQQNKIKYNTFITSLKYFSIWGEAGHLFTETFDYYEPRSPGWYYLKPKASWMEVNLSSDYRKILAIDVGINFFYSNRDNTSAYSANLSPIVRFNDHLTIKFTVEHENTTNDFGYVAEQDNKIIFGKRAISITENSLDGKYLFMNDLSLSIVVRHYISKGKYDSFYTLLENGRLEPNTDYNANPDFTFNTFNIDMIFSWVFLPGSSLNFVWKNEIGSEKNNTYGNYFENLNNTFDEPQRNNISIKALYYIDYQRLKKK
jgi:hypothetical protein